MNREMRRLQAKEEERAKKRRQDKVARSGQKKERTTPRQYIREVRQELKKVAWPSREELTTYTIVVFTVTTVLTLVIFGMDWVFNRGVLWVLENVG